MEGRLCRWALALQEFDFTIKYSKGINNQNADALSRLVSDRSNHFNAAVQVVAPIISNQELQSAQTADPVISKVISTLLEGAEPQVIPTAATIEWDTPRKADFWDRGQIQ
ncbi:hypothetical protein D918_09350 [Trichuris suis]|nr:hypothetical protein D918_09350 [Trichuris suis]